MQVFKFGGASVKSAIAVKNVSTILNSYGGENVVVIISAMGKSTNLLEKICVAYCNGNSFYELLNEFKSFHRAIINDLLEEGSRDYYDIEKYVGSPKHIEIQILGDSWCSLKVLSADRLIIKAQPLDEKVQITRQPYLLIA